mmetsp:Transcript_9734/g.24529  ORF Transcript_9734/g.24529 Transcript_9734/m.24529 type:complete len:95 (+) Transcript_9734:3-287(+)
MGSAEPVATAAFALPEMVYASDDGDNNKLRPGFCIRRVFTLLVLIPTTKRCPLSLRGRAFQALAFAIDSVVWQFDGMRLLEDTAPSKAAAEELT